MAKRKKHFNGMFYNLVLHVAIALLAVNALGVAGIQMLALSWVVSFPRYYPTATYFWILLLTADGPLG